MQKKNYKGRKTKATLPKFEGTCTTYNDLQHTYALQLSKRPEIQIARSNVLLKGFASEQDYTSDFVCEKKSGEVLVRECVIRSKLTMPNTAKLLEQSRSYWKERGVKDWGVVVDAPQ